MEALREIGRDEINRPEDARRWACGEGCFTGNQRGIFMPAAVRQFETSDVGNCRHVNVQS